MNTYGSFMKSGVLAGDVVEVVEHKGIKLDGDSLYGDQLDGDALYGDAQELGVDIVGINPMQLARKMASGMAAQLTGHELRFLSELYKRRKAVYGAIQGHGNMVRSGAPLVNAIPGVTQPSKGRGPVGVQFMGTGALSGGVAYKFDSSTLSCTAQIVPQRPFKLDALVASTAFKEGAVTDLVDIFPIVLTAFQIGTHNVLAAVGGVDSTLFQPNMLNNIIEQTAASPGVIISMTWTCPNALTDGSKILTLGAFGREVF